MAIDSDSVTETDLAVARNDLSTPHSNDQGLKSSLERTNFDRDGEEMPTEETKETRNLERSYPSTSRRLTIVAALCLGTLLNAIDITIIGVAIPTISTVFNALDDVGWYGTAYLVTLTALQPIFGITYKYFDPRITYLFSVLLFEVGSVLSASATSSAIFIVGRAITGCGGAGILQGALCIVALIVPLNKRAFYLGIVVSSFGAAACFGPIMGGALTDHASWRWCFWINVPIGGVVAAIVIFFLKLDGIDTRERRLPIMKKLRHLDPLGATLLMGSVCCLALALQWGGATLKWRSAKVIGLFVGFGFLGMAFFVFEWKAGDSAMLPLRVFGQRSILLGCFYVCFFQMINDSVTYYIPFYFQAAQGASAMSSGAKFISLVLPEIIAVVVVAAVVGKIGQYISFMVSGALIAAVGIGLLTRITVGTSTTEWAAYMVVSGLGIGMGINLPYTTLHVVLSEDDIPIGNGITVLSGQLGGAIAVSAGQSTFLNSLLREAPKRVAGLSAQVIVNTGATRLQALTTDINVLRQVQIMYADAVTSTLWLPVGAASAAAFCACGMDWRRLNGTIRTVVSNEHESPEKAGSGVSAMPPDMTGANTSNAADRKRHDYREMDLGTNERSVFTQKSMGGLAMNNGGSSM